MSSQKGARSELADVLADIKNSRAEDELDSSSQDVAPTPAKRRSAVNYKVLSGHAPRQSRSSTASNSSATNQVSTNHNHHHHETRSAASSTAAAAAAAAATAGTTTGAAASTPTAATTQQQQNQPQRSYVLKLYDRPIDLAEFIKIGEEGEEEEQDDDEKAVEVPLYPVCRAWVHGQPKSQQPGANSKNLASATQAATNNHTSNADKPAASPNCVAPPEQAAGQQDSEVFTMPPPLTKAEVLQSLNLPVQEESVDIRIPESVRNFTKPENAKEMIDNSIQSMERNQCLELNKRRWKKVREDWCSARRIHEARYEKSFKILQDMVMVSSRAV